MLRKLIARWAVRYLWRYYTRQVFYKNGELINFDTQMSRKLDAVAVLMDD